MILEEFIIKNFSLTPLILLVILFFIFSITFFFRRILFSQEKIEKIKLKAQQEADKWEEFLNSLSEEERKEFLLNDPRSGIILEHYEEEGISERELEEKIFSLSNKEISEIIAKKLVGGEFLNRKFWLPLFFIVMPLWLLVFYIFFRWIQFFILGSLTAKYIFVESQGIFVFPLIFFTLFLAGGIMEFFVGKDFVISRLGNEYYSKTYLGGRRSAILIIKIALLILIPIIILCLFHYIKIKEEGIYINRWLSLKERYYSWDDIERIYLEEGRILKGENKPKIYSNEKNKYKYPFIILFMHDGSKIEFDPYGNMVEINRRRKEAINFVIQRTALSVEKKIYNTNTKQYIDWSIH